MEINNSIIQQFYSDEFGSLDILILNGKPYFPAAECAEKLGYSKPHNAVSRHCRDSLKRGVIDNIGRTQEKIFIPEGDLYRLIIRSKLPSARRFEGFVCDVILPSIRKYGAYVTPDTLEEMVASPEFAATLLEELQKERQKTAALTPKALYYDKILQCGNAIPISLIAKDYGLSALSFNNILHDFCIQYRVAGTWLLYQKYAGCGYTQTKTYHYGENGAALHTCWTQKGRLFLYEFLAAHNIHPLAESIEKMESFVQMTFDSADGNL